MIDFLSLYFLKKFSLNALDKVENRSTLINKTLCHFTPPPPVCQNDTVYKLNVTGRKKWQNCAFSLAKQRVFLCFRLFFRAKKSVL